MSSSELVRNDVIDVGQPARERFAPSQRDLIRATIAPQAPEEQFDLFLEVCARYSLNPLVGEAYLAPMPGGQGMPPRWTTIVGRHGWMAMAQRHSDFRGVRGDVVRARDSFSVEYGATGIVVHHRYDLGLDDYVGVKDGKDISDEDAEPQVAADENADQRTERKRGRIVGAWALVHREGHEPAYYFAPWGEYAPSGDRIKRNKYWRDTPSAAIYKCALVNALRDAYSLSGLYDEAERHLMAADEAPVREEPDWGDSDDPALAERLRDVVSRAGREFPGEYRPAKVRALLDGATTAEREAFCEQLESRLSHASDGDGPVEDAEVVT